MKKVLALLLVLVLAIGMFAACGTDSGNNEETKDTANNATTEGGNDETKPSEENGNNTEGKTLKVGMICIGDENDQGYTYNFIRGKEAATEALAAKGINVEWVVKYNKGENDQGYTYNFYRAKDSVTEKMAAKGVTLDWNIITNIGEDDGCTDACVELAEAGCDVVICNSYGHEPYMLKAAPDYPNVQFIGCTNLNSQFAGLDNCHNAFANIYEGRYVAGVVAGMKIKELIDSGKITADQAKIGYVGAFPFAEVISGFTAFYLGARSIVPEVTMTVKYVSSWSDATAEGNAAQALCDEGCVLISQHSDNTTPATVAQQNGVFHVGYNNDMTGIAPEASLLSSRIDWSVYFEYVFDCLVNGETIAKDWTAGIKDGAVVVTELNEAIAAEGTADKIAEVEAGLADGSIHVFQGPWKGEGTAYGADAPDTKEMPADDWFKESDVEGGQTSAPYFYWVIEGITSEN